MARIGIMSFAHMHADSYAACLNQVPEAELTALWDDNAKRGRAAAKTHQTRFVSDRARFLALDLDGVIVCSENVHHRAQVEAAAAAGKSVLCEKPLATTATDARAMIKACAKAKVLLGTAFPCRFAQTLRDARDRIRGGAVGPLRAVACTNNGSYPGGWFADEALSGGGAVMDHTVHVADVLRWITGKEFTRVYCEMGNLIHKGIGTEDVGSLHFEMEGGLIASHVASWTRAKSFPTWGDVTLQFAGRDGVLNVDAFGQKVEVYSDRAMKAEWAYWGSNADLDLVRDFVTAIHEGRPPGATGLDGLRAVEVTQAAYRSARTGRMVPV